MEGFAREVQLLGQPCQNRPAKFARTSLSACGLPTPVVAFACIGNVDIQVFSGVGGRLYFIRRLQVFASLEKGGGPPLGGGGIRPRSATSSAAMSKPSGEIRSYLAVRLGLANADSCLCLYR